jgi:hypothetical protein
MGTTIIDHPVLPAEIQQSLGHAAQQRVAIRETKLTDLELRGEIKPATILNRSPFELKVETGLWSYVVPPRPDGKPFSHHTITGTVSYPIYKGNMEMSDKSLRANYDVNILLPIVQAMEFKFWYIGVTDEDKVFKQGGVVVFEGDMEGLTPKSEVRVPQFTFKKGRRYMTFSTRVLKDMLDEADEQMRMRCMAVLEQAGHWADDPKQRANIQRAEHTWADFALKMNWIQTPVAWRNTQVRAEDCCPRCNVPYVSKTGMCKCSYVYDPFVAFMSGEITQDHVRLQTLNAEQWKKVKAEIERRQKAMA